jgi:hypothetical protein
MFILLFYVYDIYIYIVYICIVKKQRKFIFKFFLTLVYVEIKFFLINT